MSTNTWSQYVTMDEQLLDSGRFQSELRTTLDLADDGDEWTADFDLGQPWDGDEITEED